MAVGLKVLDGDAWSDQDLAALPVEKLEMLSALLSMEDEALKRRKERLHKALVSRFGQGLQPGTHWTDASGRKVKIEVPKQVEWDQGGLQSVAEHIKRKMGEDPREYIEFKLFVPENRYRAWPEAIKSLFEPSRTVSAGKPRFTFWDPKTSK